MNIYHARLLMLADKLETINPHNFNMSFFYEDGAGGCEPYHAEPDSYACGTVACALGWSLSVPELHSFVKNHFTDHDCYSWESISLFLFDLKAGTVDWAFLFSADWDYGAGSPLEAAQRIRYYVKHGRSPLSFYRGDLRNYAVDYMLAVKEDLKS